MFTFCESLKNVNTLMNHFLAEFRSIKKNKILKQIYTRKITNINYKQNFPIIAIHTSIINILSEHNYLRCMLMKMISSLRLFFNYCTYFTPEYTFHTHLNSIHIEQ